jgi:hypothetical protein
MQGLSCQINDRIKGRSVRDNATDDRKSNGIMACRRQTEGCIDEPRVDGDEDGGSANKKYKVNRGGVRKTAWNKKVGRLETKGGVEQIVVLAMQETKSSAMST